jgi:TPR repeat protein
MKLKTLLLTLLLLGISTNGFADFNDGVKAYKNNDNQTAFVELKPLAEQGDSEAQYYFGLMFYNGRLPKSYLEKEKSYFFVGDKKIYRKTDKNTAFKWIEKAAIQGHSDAQHQLGLMYYRGDTLDISIERNNKVRESWHKAGQNNTMESWLESAKHTEKGKAIGWWLESAQQGNVDAQSTLAFRYYTGDGIDKNFSEAFKWYKKAAENGDPLTIAPILGDMYYKGQGTTKNYKEAAKWWGKSAESGSIYSLINLLNSGLDVHILKADMFRWLNKAAKKGYSFAYLDLGVKYYTGEGVLKDMTKAKYWIKKAYEGDDTEVSKTAKNYWNTLELWKY